MERPVCRYNKAMTIAERQVSDVREMMHEPQPHRFTREQYYQMADQGWFNGRRVELIDGEIVDMAAQKNLHVLGVSMGMRALGRAFGEAYWIRSQAPLRIGAGSDPEPDLAVVPGPMEGYKDHPTTALLVMEIADTTLRYDRQAKGPLYAQAGIRDYWIVNVAQGCVEVLRDPVNEAGGWRYESATINRAGETISPLARPEAKVAVSDLLP